MLPRACATRVAALLPVLAPFACPSNGDLRPASGAESETARASASAKRLWVARVGPARSLLFSRSVFGDFDAGQPVNGRIAMMAADRDDVFLVLEDGSLYRYGPGRSASERVLPQRARPIDLACDDGVLYALVRDYVAALLRPGPAGATLESAADVEDDLGSLSVVRYDGLQWSWLASAPPGTRSTGDAAMRPRLAPDARELFLARRTTPGTLQVLRHQEDGSWVTEASFDTPRLRAFWIGSITRVPTIVVLRGSDRAAPQIQAYRRLGEGEGRWLPADVRLSDREGSAEIGEVRDLFAFNQSVGVLEADHAGDEMYLRFGGVEGQALEPTVRLSTVFRRPEVRQQVNGLLRMASLMVMAALLGSLLLFRRTGLVRPVVLPTGLDPALVSQRVAAAGLDFAPFFVAGAVMLGLSPTEGLRSLATWAFGGADVDLPSVNVLTWWGLSVTGWTLYCTVLELATGRTVGKLLLGIRLLSETGTRPRHWQVLARNGSRLLELLPHLWAFGLLILISRNRQRLGDLLSQTVVVRTVEPQGTASGPGPRDDEPKGR
jgi:uncharacterized RDD family membrane protein YckC